MAALHAAFAAALLLTVALAGSASPQGEAAAEKVVEMLQKLRTEVQEAGTKENSTYQKFATFCKDTKAEKELSIETNSNTKAELEAKMDLLKVKQQELATTMSKLSQDIDDTKTKLHSMAASRASDRTAHVKNVGELQSALASVEKAIVGMKVAQGSFLQQSSKSAVGRTVQKALEIAKANDLPSAYSFQSSSVIDTLEGLQKDFKTALNEAELSEAKAHGSHLESSLVLEQELTRLEQELSEDSAAQGLKKEEFHVASQELAATEADLADDVKYLNETTAMCEEKAATFANRSTARAEELEALSTASVILKESLGKNSSEVSFGLTGAAPSLDLEVAAEAAAEAAEASSSLLQGHSAVLRGKQDTPLLPTHKVTRLHSPIDTFSRRATNDDKRQALEELLRTKAEEIKSPALLVLANSAAKDPLEKVRKMVSGLITDLQHQMAESQTHQAYCDKTTSETEAKRDHSATAIEGLNLQISQQQARRDQLIQAIALLQHQIDELNTSKANATELRQEESAEANASATEARQARDAVAKAKQVIQDYYSSAGEKSETAFVIVKADPAAPNAGFENGESYKGDQAGAGVLDMLDVAESTFEKTAEEIEAEEKKAAAEHISFLHDTEVSIAEKEEATKTKKTFKLETLEQLSQDEEKLDMQSKSLKSAVSELAELDKVCGVGSTSEERQRKRQEQIESLKEAIKLLEDM